jgi:short-subunit dehydrogenase
MRALITGASSGIGEQFAYVFSEHGYDVVLVARSKDDLQRVAQTCRKSNVSVQIITCDLTADGAIHSVIETAGSIDVLVNNAGFGEFGKFTKTSWDKEYSMIDLNIRVVTQLAKHYGSTMKKGKILNVASTAAFLPGPYMAVYYATKAYVLSFSQAIAQELAPNIRVTALCPGPTKTHFAENANADNQSFFQGRLPLARDVAQYGYSALMKNKRVAVHGLKNKVMTFLTRLLPRRVQAAVVSSLSK